LINWRKWYKWLEKINLSLLNLSLLPVHHPVMKTFSWDNTPTFGKESGITSKSYWVSRKKIRSGGQRFAVRLFQNGWRCSDGQLTVPCPQSSTWESSRRTEQMSFLI
jgi:hypothetical protein